MKYHISICFLDGSECRTAIFEDEEEEKADDYIRRSLIQLLADGYKVDRVTPNGTIYSKGFWLWKKEVSVSYKIHYVM